MGIDAENAEQVTSEENLDELQTEEVEQEQATDEVEELDQEQESDETGESEEETQPQFTQQQLDEIVQKRVKKLNGKVETSTTEAEKAREELELEREKNRLLQLAMEQNRQPKEKSAEPKPEDFDQGEWDPEYKKAVREYQDKLIDERVAAKLQETNEAKEQERLKQQQQQELATRQQDHYKRSLNLGVTDYTDAEDKALEVLGNGNVNHIISNFDDSEVLLYHLGKNPDRAAKIGSMIKSNPIRAVAEIGRLSAELAVKPNKKPAPNPVDPLEGSGGQSRSKFLEGAKFE